MDSDFDEFHDLLMKIAAIVEDKPTNTTCATLCIILIGILKIENCTRQNFIRRMELAWDSCDNNGLYEMIYTFNEDGICH